MTLKTLLESIVVGIAAQVVVGWISPFTPILTGFLAGVVSHNEKEGTKAGLVLGIATSIGFVLRGYLNLGLPYVYPTAMFLSTTGAMGTVIVAVAMIILGIVGGRVGGSVMQRALESSYLHGKMFGEAEHQLEDYDEQLKKAGKPRNGRRSSK